MRVHSLCQYLFLLSLLLAGANFCHAGDKKLFEVVGTGDCADCKENNIKDTHAVAGLLVSIDCKLPNGDMMRVAAGQLDRHGDFKLQLPQEVVHKSGKKLKEECYAQLHSAAAVPCPAHDGIEATKIEFKSKSAAKHTFGPSKKLRFTTPLCTSEFLWPHYKYPPLPKLPPWKKHLPKFPFPPLKNWGHTLPLPPLNKPPFYKPPFVKPPFVKPPSVKPPFVKPPLPPSSKPKPPFVKPPFYKPPFVKPPFYKPPIFPLPPFPKWKKPPYPPLPKLPPLPTLPPKPWTQPKFGHWPPLPPYIPHA